MAIAIQGIGQFRQGDIGLLLNQLTQMVLHGGGNAWRRAASLSPGRQTSALAPTLQEFFHERPTDTEVFGNLSLRSQPPLVSLPNLLPQVL